MVGLCGAIILTLSFNHVVWGGFILTESLGVLMMLILLSCVAFLKKDKESSLFMEIATGVSLGLAVMTRYEYSLVIVPAILFLRTLGYHRIFIILSSAFMTITLFVTTLFPLPYPLGTVFAQFKDHHW